MKRKNLLPAAAASLLTSVFCTAVPTVFIRNIGSLIQSAGQLFGLNYSEIKQFGEIFDQLKDASVLPPYWLTALIFAAGIAAALWALSGTKRRLTAVAVVWILLLIPLTVLLLWFTLVNGLRFGTVISALIRLLSAGVL